jgi:hypothetical protein
MFLRILAGHAAAVLALALLFMGSGELLSNIPAPRPSRRTPTIPT